MIEVYIHQLTLTELDEDTVALFKATCRRYASDMVYDFDFNQYTVYFEPENWLLATLAMPELTRIFRKETKWEELEAK